MTLTRKLIRGYHVLILDTIGSTNDEAKRMAREGAPARSVVLARRQSAGRGRRGRAWQSPPGNLYASILLDVRARAHRAAELSFVAALAVADAIRRFAGSARRVECKWPNDVLLNGAKVAGVLLESEEGPAEAAVGGAEGLPSFLVLGIGVNIVCHPEADGYRATSLSAEGCQAPASEALLEALLAALNDWDSSWRVEGFAPIRAAWEARAKGLGGPIEVRTGADHLSGTFAGLDETGALRLALADGAERRLSAGEVFFEDA